MFSKGKRDSRMCSSEGASPILECFHASLSRLQVSKSKNLYLSHDLQYNMHTDCVCHASIR